MGDSTKRYAKFVHGLPGIVYANVAGIFESVLRVMGKWLGKWESFGEGGLKVGVWFQICVTRKIESIIMIIGKPLHNEILN